MACRVIQNGGYDAICSVAEHTVADGLLTEREDNSCGDLVVVIGAGTEEQRLSAGQLIKLIRVRQYLVNNAGYA